MSDYTNDELYSDLLGFAASELSAPVAGRLYDYACYDFATQKQNLFAALAAAAEKERLAPPPPEKGLRTVDDLVFSEDMDFDTTFRLTRKTVRVVINELKKTRCQLSHSLDHGVLLTLWYLGSTESNFADAAYIFRLDSADDAEALFVETCSALGSRLSDSAKLRWPTPAEFADIELTFATRYKFPKLAGVLGCFVMMMKDERSSVTVQVVIDDQQRMRDCHAVCGETWAAQVLRDSALGSRYDPVVPPGLHLLAGSVYPQDGVLLTPYCGRLTAEEACFNGAHAAVLRRLSEAMNSAVARFPKLGRLCCRTEAVPAAVKAAMVLYNLASIHRDLAMIAPVLLQ